MDPLYLTDAEIAQRLGLPQKQAKIALAALENMRGFPHRDPLFGQRRYWPAIKKFLDHRHGLNAPVPLSVPDGEENFHATPGNRKRTWTKMAAT